MDNPYQPPSTGDEPLLPVAELKDPRSLAMVSLWLYGLGTVAEVARYFHRWTGPGQRHDSTYVVIAGVEPLDALLIVTGLASSIVYLFWKYRVATNARVLDPSLMKVSPAMAVGSYFIPFANFVIPCKAMVGIARATLGEARGVGLWWTGHVGLLVFVFLPGLLSDPLSSELSAGDHFYLIWSVITFLLSWWLVMRITRAQSAKCAA